MLRGGPIGPPRFVSGERQVRPNGIAYIASNIAGDSPDSMASHLLAVNTTNGQEIWRLVTEGVWVVSYRVVNDVLLVASVYGSEDVHIAVQAVHITSGEELWRLDFAAQLDADINFTPVASWPLLLVSLNVQEGMVIVAGLGYGDIHAIDISSGNVIWRHPMQNSLTDLTVHNHIVLAASVDQNEEMGEVRAIDASSGEEFWTQASSIEGIHRLFWRFSNNQPEPSQLQQLTISAGFLLIPGMAQDALDAVDVRTGSQIWRFSGGDYLNTLAVLDGTTFVASGSMNRVIDEHAEFTLHALDSTSGEEIWRHTTVGLLSATLDDTTIYTSGILTALDISTGLVRWQDSSEYYWNAPAIHQGIALATGIDWYGNESEPGLPSYRAFDADTGEVLWDTPLDSNQPYADDLFVAYDELTAYITFPSGSHVDPSLFAVDYVTGEVLWRFEKPGRLLMSTLHDGTMYATVVNDGWTGHTVYAISNLQPMLLKEDVQLRAAPSQNAVERGTAKSGDRISHIGSREARDGDSWIEVTIHDITGWIPMDTIDPATLPPEGEIEYVYVPE